MSCNFMTRKATCYTCVEYVFVFIVHTTRAARAADCHSRVCGLVSVLSIPTPQAYDYNWQLWHLALVLCYHHKVCVCVTSVVCV